MGWAGGAFYGAAKKRQAPEALSFSCDPCFLWESRSDAVSPYPPIGSSYVLALGVNLFAPDEALRYIRIALCVGFGRDFRMMFRFFLSLVRVYALASGDPSGEVLCNPFVGAP